MFVSGSILFLLSLFFLQAQDCDQCASREQPTQEHWGKPPQSLCQVGKESLLGTMLPTLSSHEHRPFLMDTAYIRAPTCWSRACPLLSDDARPTLKDLVLFSIIKIKAIQPALHTVTLRIQPDGYWMTPFFSKVLTIVRSKF